MKMSLRNYIPNSIPTEYKKCLMTPITDLKKSDFRKELEEVIIPLFQNKRKGWKRCLFRCYRVLRFWINKEMYSTAFMLRVIYHSIIGTKNNLRFEFSKKELTGVWNYDKKYISLVSSENVKNRLIFGFGPSASGKTFLMTTLLKLLQKKISSFPKTFLTIDGGIYREVSVVYQTIVDITKQFHYGISNLAIRTISSIRPLFKSSWIKTQIIHFLKKDKTQKFSLYVPETLSVCSSKSNCLKIIKKYNSIVNDNDWIGIMIYQHSFQKNCSFLDEYKCEGCYESGKKREVKQGKKYSKMSWNSSYKNGMKMMEKVPQYRFLIHNSGTDKRPSILTDFSKTPLFTKHVSKSIKIFSPHYLKN
jgi:Cdc6-like AAA superfamily ATPase